MKDVAAPSWAPFAHAQDYAFDADSVRRKWARLHAGDREALPTDAKVLAAWVLFHQGKFQRAYEAGLKAGPAGATVANKAACIYANYLEPKEKTKLELFLEVAQHAAEQAAVEPDNANAHYWQAYALGRYSQGISVAKALAQGLGGKVKAALETTIRLEPLHADAHIALGTFHAEVIDKVGALIGAMTYGAKKDTSLKLFQQALVLTPKSPIAMVEYANAMVMLEGDKRMPEATQLYEQAAKTKPLDAMERLDVDLALAELQD
jgi:tetratricopeptide (TPR) repeat protein